MIHRTWTQITPSFLSALAVPLSKKKCPYRLVNRLTGWKIFRLDHEKVTQQLSLPLKTTEELHEEVGLCVTNIQEADWNDASPIIHWAKWNNYSKEIKLNLWKQVVQAEMASIQSSKKQNALNNANQQLQRDIPNVKIKADPTHHECRWHLDKKQNAER